MAYKRSGSSGKIGVAAAPQRPSVSKAIVPTARALPRPQAGYGLGLSANTSASAKPGTIGGGGQIRPGGLLTSSFMGGGAQGSAPGGGAMSASAYANAPWQQGMPQMSGSSLGTRPGATSGSAAFNAALQAAGYYGLDSKGGMGGSGGSGAPGGGAGGMGGGANPDDGWNFAAGASGGYGSMPQGSSGNPAKGVTLQGQQWMNPWGAQGYGGQLMNAQGQTQTFGGGGRHGGYYDPGSISFGMSDVGQGQSRYVDPKTGELRTRIGSVNYDQFAGIQNFLQNTGQQGADYLRSMGIMPSYNGRAIDQFSGPQTQWSTSGGDPWAGKQTFMGTDSSGKAQYSKVGWLHDQKLNTPGWVDWSKQNQNYQILKDPAWKDSGRNGQHARKQLGISEEQYRAASKAAKAGDKTALTNLRKQYESGMGSEPGGFGDGRGWVNRGGGVVTQPNGSVFNPAAAGGSMMPGGATMGGGGFSGGGMSGGAAMGGLDNQIAGAYSGLIGSGGGIGADLENSMVNQRRGTIDRATRDAVTKARVDAARRGDVSGSSLADLEARIRSTGSSKSAEADFDTRSQLRQEQMNRLLSALGGASGFTSGMRRDELLLAQALGQQGLGAGLGMILNI